MKRKVTRGEKPLYVLQDPDGMWRVENSEGSRWPSKYRLEKDAIDAAVFSCLRSTGKGNEDYQAKLRGAYQVAHGGMLPAWELIESGVA
jgi:hypothetical protein